MKVAAAAWRQEPGVLDGEVGWGCAAGGERIGCGLLGGGWAGGEGEEKAGGEAGEETSDVHGFPSGMRFNNSAYVWYIPG